MKVKILIAVVAVAAAIGVWFFFFRRRLAAEVTGQTLIDRTPSPQAAFAALGTSLADAAAQKVTGVTHRALDAVGSAVTPNLPQSTPKPTAESQSAYLNQLAGSLQSLTKLPLIGSTIAAQGGNQAVAAAKTAEYAVRNSFAEFGYYG